MLKIVAIAVIYTTLFVGSIQTFSWEERAESSAFVGEFDEVYPEWDALDRSSKIASSGKFFFKRGIRRYGEFLL